MLPSSVFRIFIPFFFFYSTYSVQFSFYSSDTLSRGPGPKRGARQSPQGQAASGLECHPPGSRVRQGLLGTRPTAPATEQTRSQNLLPPLSAAHFIFKRAVDRLPRLTRARTMSTPKEKHSSPGSHKTTQRAVCGWKPRRHSPHQPRQTRILFFSSSAPSQECWDHRRAPWCPVYAVLSRVELSALWMPDKHSEWATSPRHTPEKCIF